MDKEQTAPAANRPLSGLDSLAAAAEDAAMAESRSSAAESRNPTAWIHETPVKEQGDDGEGSQNGALARDAQQDAGNSSSLSASQNRRPPNPAAAIGSVYSGGKIKHLKKEDGTPLWRKDIQFSFLKAVFEDSKPVFTSFEDGSKGHSFADIYIRAMAQSSKCSKVLRDRLLENRESAMNMAMICLLVNVGRMNTTLNFFPEMRAQLRTYHAIPCLQADEDPNSGAKGLQDAPRLKSILKGAQEDKEQPNTLDKIQSAAVPRTNPVNLIFVLSHYVSKVTEIHFSTPVDFFDLITRGTLSSKSRARAFLWLLWWYLESDFSDQQALDNPYGPGKPDPEDPKSRPLMVSDFEHLSEEQADAENIDTEEEKAYGWKMKDVRKRILDNEESFVASGKKPTDRPGSPRIKDELGAGASPAPTRGSVGSRSPSPSQTPIGMQRSRDGHTTGKKPVGRVSLKLKDSRLGPGSSPAPPGQGHPVFSTGHGGSGAGGSVGRGRSRPETSHQRAVHANKQARIGKILHSRLRSAQREVREQNRSRFATKTGLALYRIMALPDDYDSEDDNAAGGPGGLVPVLGRPLNEADDFGAEATRVKKVLNRACRRITREGNVLAGIPTGVNGVSRNSRRRALENGDDDTASQATLEDAPSHAGGSRRFKSGHGRMSLPRSPLARRVGAHIDSDRMDSDMQGDEDDLQDSGIDDLTDLDETMED